MLTVQEINHAALYQQPLSQAVSSSKRLLYDMLCVVYGVYRLGADQEEVTKLRKQIVLEYQRILKLEQSEFAVHKREQEQIRKTEVLLGIFLVTAARSWKQKDISQMYLSLIGAMAVMLQAAWR